MIRISAEGTKFRDLITEGCYYVDKTRFLAELLQFGAAAVNVITRPRRFGKTLTMDMLAEFFDIQKDSASLFDGLYISTRNDICSEYMNQYPVISVSFRTVFGKTYESAHEALCNLISGLYRKNSWLKDSAKLTDARKEQFEQIAEKKATDVDYLTGLSALADMLQAHYGRKVIVLMDDYDAPLVKAGLNGYDRSMLDDMRSVLNVSDHESVEFAVVMGCLQAENGIVFARINAVFNTIQKKRFSDCFGFTQDEVDEILEDTGLSACRETIREWYDGYIFADMQLYCPWDIMHYVNDVLEDPKRLPGTYWINTSGNGIIADFLKERAFAVGGEFEALLSGRSIRTIISSGVRNPAALTDEEFWSVLFMAGYLTIRDKEGRFDEYLPLRIPNKEIMALFDSEAKNFLESHAIAVGGTDFYAALWSGDVQGVQYFLHSILFRSIRCDYPKSFYHRIVAALLTNPDNRYTIVSGMERGSGRPDFVVEDSDNERALILEFGTADSRFSLEAESDAALNRIETGTYAEGELSRHFKKVFCYGISFCRQMCAVSMTLKSAESSG